MLGFIDNPDPDRRASRFERLVLPNLDAAYNLARWLTRDGHLAQDVVQEACVRALRFIDSCQGDEGRAWLLAIVRNTFFSSLRKHALEESRAEIDEGEAPWADPQQAWGVDPAELLSRKSESARIDAALLRLPLDYREVIILRLLEDLSYREIAQVLDVPIGTVMSRLSRARNLLARDLCRGGK